MKNRFHLAFLLLAFSISAQAQVVSWKSYYAPDYAEIRDVSYANNRFVAVGDDNTILYSATGASWSKGKLPTGLNCHLNAAAAAFGQFFAGGVNTDTNEAVLLLSLDGMNWADITTEVLQENYSGELPNAIAAIHSSSIAGVEKIYLSVDSGIYYDNILISSDGGKWEKMPSFYINGSVPDTFFKDSARDFIYRAYGSSWYFYSPYYYNRLDYGYELVQTKLPANLTSFAFGNSVYVGAGPSRKLGYATGNITSYNLATTYATSPAICDYTGIAFGGNAFAATGTNGALVVSYDNGKSWSAITSLNLGTITLNGIKYLGGKFIAFGSGRIITGEAAVQRTWTAATLPTGAKKINALATNGSILVTVGEGGQILYSKDGKSWSKTAPVTSYSLTSVDYDPTTRCFYAAGASGTLLKSPDGIYWTAQRTNTSSVTFVGLARTQTNLITVSTTGSVLTSKDGKSWTLKSSSTLNFAGRVTSFGNTTAYFQTTQKTNGPVGQILASTDGGSKWSALKSPAATLFNDAAGFNGAFYMAGSNGAIYRTTSANLNSWTAIATQSKNKILGVSQNADAAGQLTAVGENGFVYTIPKAGAAKVETVFNGQPYLVDTVKFGNLWIVAGSRSSKGFVGYTDKN
jgi:photosystem II stability/assembly factor-like uncharacterized protein